MDEHIGKSDKLENAGRRCGKAEAKRISFSSRILENFLHGK
jgi:hypothetical protein